MASKQLLIVAAVLVVPAFAADLLVGDDKGWAPNVDYDKWVHGNEFIVGNTLVFKYAKGQHTVVEATPSNFAACSQANSLRLWSSGEDRVALTTSGQRWFFCGVGDDCAQGMRFNVTVLPAVKLSSSSPPPHSRGGSVAAVLAASAVVVAALLF
ncbi:blue copper protein 1a-like [Phragmites australis]|uniref:blue copper protein 1a-like n=1 Tax=Phragmites australis TaxID=29695 RepID=UPI002D78935E|nr:blue copper protein 1a-like [Phragmites australis]